MKALKPINLPKPITANTLILEAGGGAARMLVNWHPPSPANTVSPTGHLVVTTTLRLGTTPAITHSWIISAIPGGGWPLTLAQQVILNKTLNAEVPSPTVPHLGPFGMRVEHAVTPMLRLFIGHNATTRSFSLTYQRKKYRDRFGMAKVVANDGDVFSHQPFILVWERPARGGADAASRGLVKAKGGKSVLETVLAQANGRGVAHTLSAQDVAERLLRVEATLQGLDVKPSMLVDTQVTISPILPKSAKFWAVSKSGVAYTTVTLLRLEAGCWVLVSAHRPLTKAVVKPTVVALPIAASAASLVGHMRARDLDLKLNTTQRIMILLNEWREGQEMRRLKRKPNDPSGVPIRAEAANPGQPHHDRVYEAIRDELVELIQQDEELWRDIDNHLHDPALTFDNP